jgi:DNA-binding response OmpR family regulator
VEVFAQSMEDSIIGSRSGKHVTFDCVFMVECTLHSLVLQHPTPFQPTPLVQCQDREMPVMGGVESTARITAMQQGQPSSVPVPIIGLSASVESTDEWKEAGMITMLGKPFMQGELRRVLTFVDARRASVSTLLPHGLYEVTRSKRTPSVLSAHTTVLDIDSCTKTRFNEPLG